MILSLCVFASCIQIPVYAAENDHEEEKKRITAAAREIGVVLDHCYENMKDKVRDLAAEGYDFELTMESMEDKGKPFSDFDYRQFLAAYAVIRSNVKDRPVSINDVSFIKFLYTPEFATEYVPVKLPRYTEDADGLFVRSGIYYAAEPCSIDTFTEAEDGIHYRKTGTEYIRPNRIRTKYADVTLAMAELDSIYESFGLKRADYKDEEEKRRAKIDEIMKEADLVQNVVYSFHIPTGGIESEIAAQGMQTTTNPFRQYIVATAASLIGRVPYLWGGKSSAPGFDPTWYTFDKDTHKQKGLDCSGFTQWVLRTTGYEHWDSLGWTGYYLSSPYLDVITREELQAGDFGLFYPNTERTNHVGIYLGNGYWIHCSSSRNGVVVSQNSDLKFAVFRRIKGIDSADVNMALPEDMKTADIKSEEQQEEIPVLASFAEMAEQIRSGGTTVTAATSTAGRTKVDSTDLILMAKVVQLESIGEGYNGWVAVADVIRNRVLSSYFSQNTVAEVLSAPEQFATYEKALAMDDSELDPRIVDVCRGVLDGELTFFNLDDVIGFRTTRPEPDDLTFCGWSRYMILGNHSFYREPEKPAKTGITKKKKKK